jgi:hypothetical protein
MACSWSLSLRESITQAILGQCPVRRLPDNWLLPEFHLSGFRVYQALSIPPATFDSFRCQIDISQTIRAGNVKEHEPKNTKLTVAIAFVVVMVCAVDAYPCKTARSVSNLDMVREADAIVRVAAESYTVPPKAPTSPTGFDVEMDSRIRFKVLEVVRGKVPEELVLPRVLVDTDDFNDPPRSRERTTAPSRSPLTARAAPLCHKHRL